MQKSSIDMLAVVHTGDTKRRVAVPRSRAGGARFLGPSKGSRRSPHDGTRPSEPSPALYITMQLSPVVTNITASLAQRSSRNAMLPSCNMHGIPFAL
jgi:hypothetical protein